MYFCWNIILKTAPSLNEYNPVSVYILLLSLIITLESISIYSIKKLDVQYFSFSSGKWNAFQTLHLRIYEIDFIIKLPVTFSRLFSIKIRRHVWIRTFSDIISCGQQWESPRWLSSLVHRRETATARQIGSAHVALPEEGMWIFILVQQYHPPRFSTLLKFSKTLMILLTLGQGEELSWASLKWFGSSPIVLSSSSIRPAFWE